jgi:hypothetical protein
MNRLILICAAVFCLSAGMAHARERIFTPPARLLTLDCVVEAARAHGVPLAALFGILAAEDGRTGEALRNANGTWDVGPFQINTCNINILAAIGITPEAVLRDGCVNARAAAFLLRREYERAGDIWTAVGAYHSRTPERRDAYIERVKRHLARLGRKGLAALPIQGDAR